MFPILETKRLRLREIVEEDLDTIYAIFSNQLVTQFYGQDPIVTKDQANHFIQHFQSLYVEKRGIRWGIERKGEKGLIGTVGYHLWNLKHNRAEIGYELHPDFWKKGYASEFIRKVINYGFNEMNLHRIGAIVFLENENSNRLLEKIGFKNEGILKGYIHQNGKFYDTHSFSILKSTSENK
jgi:[ribosomal protein S5]-alanine N-acetyltransferase